VVGPTNAWVGFRCEVRLVSSATRQASNRLGSHERFQLRVIVNLEDGTVRSQDLAEVVSIQKKRKIRKARFKESLK